MRIIPALCALSLLFALDAPAQDPDLPKSETPNPHPASAAEVQPTPAPALIPPDILSPAERAVSTPLPAPNLPTIPELDNSFKKNPLTPAADGARLRIEWRQLRNRTKDDPEVKAALQLADKARTDLERRNRLRRYYEIFYGKMDALASDPASKAYLADRKREQIAGLAQPRVRPTPTPSPTPKPAPVPEPPLPSAAPDSTPSPTAAPTP